MAGSSPPQRLRNPSERPYSQLTTNPARMPPIATLKNSTVAPPMVKIMVPIATATANFRATRPEASFISASPCRMPMIFFGIRPSPTIPERATASVGDSTAASANAGISGMPGTIQ
ncbi:hypothetical protein D3C72_1902790 [compost metagenome]